MATPDTTARFEVKIPTTWTQASARARITTEGSLELELFDFSDQAQQSMGNDVAWIWTVEAEDMPALLRALPVQAALSDQALIDALVSGHGHVHAIRDWIRAQNIPLRENFDSWA